MDTSKEYRNMLKAAPEIQSLWKPSIGDYHLWNNSIELISTEHFRSSTRFWLRDKEIWGDRKQYGQYIIGYFNEWVVMDFDKNTQVNCEEIIKEFQKQYTRHNNTLWLPRQDQLQDILDENYVHIIGEFKKFAYSEYNNSVFSACGTFCPTENGSMEQLWLAFVMNEKYNKVWDGTKWIK